MGKKRFHSEKSANKFAEKVNGKINDLREIKESKSSFSVTYEKTNKTKKYGKDINRDWSPEEGRDFGYSNEYWQ
tara:strand:+ start:397 stop:618 length:222 start_codon:yes stop_codon:yes gene_type:complete